MVVASINFVIALILAIYIWKGKGPLSVLHGLALYITFHYAYSAIPFFIGNPYLWRTETQIGAKIIGFLFILLSVIELYRRYAIKTIRRYKLSWNITLGGISLAWLFGTLLFWLIGFYAQNSPSRVMIQDTLSVSIMIMLIFGIAFSLKENSITEENSWEKIAKLSFPVLVSMAAVGFYQILFAQTAAGVSLENGEYVRRASSFLFNPNVLGFWASLVVFFFSYACHSSLYTNRFSISMMIIAGFCIFLSGSRSSALICLFLLCLSGATTIFSRNRRSRLNAFAPMVGMVAATVVLFSTIRIVDSAFGHAVSWLRSCSLLVDRFLAIPGLLGLYIGNKIGSSYPRLGSIIRDLVPMPVSHQIVDLEKFQMTDPNSANILLNIEHRIDFNSEMADNGFIAIFEAGGWQGLLPWVLFWVLLLGFGFRMYYRRRDVNSGYALTVILGCAFSALFMRLFQVFPFWVMVALCLGPTFSWIFRDDSARSINEETLQT